MNQVIDYPNGDKYEGNLNKDGKRHGKGIMIYANGDKYSGEWKNGWKKNGIMTYANGDEYRGEWSENKNEQYEGKGLMFYVETGEIYRGEWKDGKKNGYGLINYPDGQHYFGRWINDEKRDDVNESLKKKSITISIFCHGSDFEELDPLIRDVNIRILSATGESGCINFQASEDKKFMYKTLPNFFNRNKSSYENLKEIQNYLKDLDAKQAPSYQFWRHETQKKLTKEAFSKKQRYKIFTPVMDHVYNFKSLGERQGSMLKRFEFSVNDVRNNPSSPFFKNDNLLEHDLKMKYIELTRHYANQIARALFFGSDKWFTSLTKEEMKNVFEEPKFKKMFEDDGKIKNKEKLILSLGLANILQNYGINKLDEIKNIKVLPLNDTIQKIFQLYEENISEHKKALPLINIYQEFAGINSQENHSRILLSNLIKCFKRYGFEVINIVDLSCRSIQNYEDEKAILIRRAEEDNALKNMNIVDG
jgi:hypothetical protein